MPLDKGAVLTYSPHKFNVPLFRFDVYRTLMLFVLTSVAVLTLNEWDWIFFLGRYRLGGLFLIYMMSILYFCINYSWTEIMIHCNWINQNNVYLTFMRLKKVSDLDKQMTVCHCNKPHTSDTMSSSKEKERNSSLFIWYNFMHCFCTCISIN